MNLSFIHLILGCSEPSRHFDHEATTQRDRWTASCLPEIIRGDRHLYISTGLCGLRSEKS
jgi:hypothetical protein